MRLPRLAISAALSAAAGLAATGCREEVVSLRRLDIGYLDAPATLPALSPMAVTIQYLIGACDEVSRIEKRTTGQVIEIEVLGGHFPSPRGVYCPDILYIRDTTLTVSSPPTGTVTVRALRIDGPPLETTVQVAAP